MTHRAASVTAAVLVLALAAADVARAAPPSPSETEAAAAAYAAKDWKTAAAAYSRIVEGSSQNGEAWLRLGVARLESGDAAGAVAPLEKARDLGVTPLLTRYRLATANVRAGRRDATLAALEDLATAGGAMADRLAADPDFAALRAEPRFVAALDKVRKNASPCADDPLYRQFDFWRGTWNVTAQGQLAGVNRIEAVVGSCALLENWTGTSGYTGKSLNIYDPATKKWRQFYVDSGGGVTVFEGDRVGSEMRFVGVESQQGGKNVQVRMTFYDLGGAKGAERIRQLGEKTEDGGKTWTVDYDLEYQRAPADAAVATGAP